MSSLKNKKIYLWIILNTPPIWSSGIVLSKFRTQIRQTICSFQKKYSDRCLCKPEVFGQMSVQTRSIRTDVCANPKYSDRCLCKPEVFGQMSVQTRSIRTDVCANPCDMGLHRHLSEYFFWKEHFWKYKEVPFNLELCARIRYRF